MVQAPIFNEVITHKPEVYLAEIGRELDKKEK